MSNNLSSPTINKAIGKLVEKHLVSKEIQSLEALRTSKTVVTVLDCLGYLGVLDYTRFNPDLLEQSLQIGNHVLEVETTTKNEN